MNNVFILRQPFPLLSGRGICGSVHPSSLSKVLAKLLNKLVQFEMVIVWRRGEIISCHSYWGRGKHSPRYLALPASRQLCGLRAGQVLAHREHLPFYSCPLNVQLLSSVLFSPILVNLLHNAYYTESFAHSCKREWLPCISCSCFQECFLMGKYKFVWLQCYEWKLKLNQQDINYV
jgi:hypothetical protein